MTIFEKTMQACREENAKKKVVEKKTTKKNVKKTVTERKTRKFEADEDDFDLDEGFGDEFADEEEGDAVDGDAEFEGDADDFAPDIEDDISFKPEDDVATVVDSDIEDDDSFLADALKALQQVNDENIEVAEDAIESTDEDEEASTDDYVGQNVYICPICGSTFFNDGELADGDACPVCGETPEKFVACGTVEANEQTEKAGEGDDEDADAEDTETEETDTEEEAKTEDTDTDDSEEDADKDEDEDEDKAKEEAYRRRRAAMRRRNEARRRNEKKSIKTEGPLLGTSIAFIQKFADKCDERGIKEAEAKKLLTKFFDENGFATGKIDKFLDANCKNCKKDTKKDTKKESRNTKKESVRRTPNLYLNEKTFERHLCKFFAENYSNVDDVTIKKAVIKEGKLGIGVTLTFKSGKTKNVPLVVENFNVKSGVYVAKDTKKAFEAKNNDPFKFKIRVENNVVSCEGMAYRFETKYEGKRVLVSGKTLNESKKKLNNRSRRVESTKKSSEDLQLDRDQIEKIKAIVDYYTYDIEEDGGRNLSDVDEKHIRYTKADREKAAKLGKLCPPMDINGGLSETTVVNFLKKERPDLYNAIADCEDENERDRIFKRIEDAAFDGDFKKTF